MSTTVIPFLKHNMHTRRRQIVCADAARPTHAELSFSRFLTHAQCRIHAGVSPHSPHRRTTARGVNAPSLHKHVRNASRGDNDVHEAPSPLGAWEACAVTTTGASASILSFCSTAVRRCVMPNRTFTAQSRTPLACRHQHLALDGSCFPEVNCETRKGELQV